MIESSKALIKTLREPLRSRKVLRRHLKALKLVNYAGKALKGSEMGLVRALKGLRGVDEALCADEAPKGVGVGIDEGPNGIDEAPWC